MLRLRAPLASRACALTSALNRPLPLQTPFMSLTFWRPEKAQQVQLEMPVSGCFVAVFLYQGTVTYCSCWVRSAGRPAPACCLGAQLWWL